MCGSATIQNQTNNDDKDKVSAKAKAVSYLVKAKAKAENIAKAKMGIWTVKSKVKANSKHKATTQPPSFAIFDGNVHFETNTKVKADDRVNDKNRVIVWKTDRKQVLFDGIIGANVKNAHPPSGEPLIFRIYNDKVKLKTALKMIVEAKHKEKNIS